MDRRDILIGAACLATAGTAYALIPRHHVTLLGAKKLDDIVPRAFAGWTSRDATDQVAPTDANSLASRLYGATVGRLYQRAGADAGVMMLLAHGDTQSDDLQVHRPEICYPAFGYALSDNYPLQIPLAGAAAIPGRHLVATGGDRRETVVYWTRLGEFLPQDRKQQQLDRLQTAMKGEVADGLLARFSATGPDAADSGATIIAFIRALIRATPPTNRPALIGRARAQVLAAIGF